MTIRMERTKKKTGCCDPASILTVLISALGSLLSVALSSG
jgi:hypothetical protein